MKAHCLLPSGRAIGDLLLAVSRYAAKLGVAPEDSLRSALGRFTSRFESIEDRVQESGRDVKDVSLEELDRYWNDAKKAVPKK